MGTIFSILHQAVRDDDATPPAQTGREQLAAGYVLYGPSTLLALSTGRSTHIFLSTRLHW